MDDVRDPVWIVRLTGVSIMKSTSIQRTILWLAGLVIIASIVSLLAYLLYANHRSQQAIDDRVGQVLREKLRIQLLAQAGEQVALIRHELGVAVNVTQQLIEVNTAFGSDESTVRSALTELLRLLLVHNPGLIATFIGWEPKGLDGVSERFLPVWIRNSAGQPELTHLAGMESLELAPEGVRKGDFYLCPKERGQLCVLDPIAYPVKDKTVLLVSVSAPIIVDGQFRGVVGADPDIGFIQELARKTAANLYDGKAEVALFGGNGRVIAYSRDPGQLNKTSDALLDNSEQDRLSRPDQPFTFAVDEHENRVELFLPFSPGSQGNQWTMMIRIPADIVFADMRALSSEFNANNQSALLQALLIVALVSFIGLLLVGRVGRGIARPMGSMVTVLKDLGKGQGDLTLRLGEERHDELGAIARGFNVFLGKLRELVLGIVDCSNQISLASGRVLETADRTRDGMSQQLREIEQVATAITEMSSSSQEVALNTHRASDAATTADLAAQSGIIVAQASVDSIRQLAGELSEALASIELLTGYSRDIDTTLSLIRAISQQTNLLALNAAIEAARAGEQGRGFAVVADEVRQLAQKSQAATKQVNQVTERLRQGTQVIMQGMSRSQAKGLASVARAEQSRDTLLSISQAVSVIRDMNAQVANASEEQSAVAEELSHNLLQIGRVCSEAAAEAERSCTESRDLAAFAHQQANLIGLFKT